MAIPAFNTDGFLPVGLYDCALDEIGVRFGSFQGSDQRCRLFERLRELLTQIAKSTLFVAVIVDGSFVTSKPIPADVDIILVLRPGHDAKADLPMFDYALVSRQRLRRRFGFDVLIAREGSMEYGEYVGFFALVRDRPGKSKGMLRVRL